MTQRPLALVVEDDREIREALADAIELGGFEVATVANGLEALRWLRGAPQLADVIVLDLMMPVMDGWQFLAARDARAKSVPVVVLTAKPDPEVPEGVRVLTKPVSLEQLVAALRPYWR